ncbi:MAG: hypothetical protein ABI867_26430 [Kofleriaceae bacterium]
MANDPNALARFVKAAHAGGCSVYDPQFGAYWPAAVGLPEAGADAWASAFFDQGFVFDDEADEGHVPETPMRLCPDDVRPVTQQVWIDVHVVAEGPLVRGLMSHRAQLYRARFPSWTITVRLGGSGAQTLRPSDCARWLERAKAKAEVVEGSDAPSIAFAVLGDFDARELAGRLEICPFELVPFSREDKLLASAFGEPVASVAVIVPKRVVASAPEVLRTALHALGDAIASLAGGASVHFADPAQADANVGANLAWVEAHVGLVPSEPIRAIAASDVPKVAVEGVSEDDEDKNK